MTFEPALNLQPACWRLGAIELDEFRLEVRRDGEPVALESKSLELLRLFVRHPGEVLTKDELMQAVWPGRVLSDSVLARSVSLLRRAIGDDEQTLIRTVHRYGYRYDGAVERLTPVETQSVPALGLQAGERPPLRTNWTLTERLGEGRNETWLAEHDKTRERRVFKFAADGAGLSALKREITLNRLLRESLPGRDDWMPLLDWNLDVAPYFIEIEYCPGGSLTRWFGEHAGCPVQTRIDLVAQAAEALAAAHSVGVLHKDVKPANLLVDDRAGRPHLRLADFGSGLLLDDAHLAALSITRLGLTLRAGDDSSSSGTPLYLAPEVVAGQPATPRSDVYALGVLLYQLIVGDLRRPLAPGWEREVGDELLREDIAAAADVEPARRLADATQLAQRLRSLAQRRDRRAAEREAAQRVEREHRQLERWRAQRLWAGAAFASLMLGLALSTALYFDARAARDHAQRAQAESGVVNDFLLNDLLAAANPELTGRSDVTVREVIDGAALRLGERFGAQPRLEAAVRRTLGETLFGLGRDEEAMQQMQRSIALLQNGDAADRREIAESRLSIVRKLMDQVRVEPARIELAKLQAEVVGTGDDLVLATRLQQIALLCMSGHSLDALPQYDEVAADTRRLLGDDAPLLARIGRFRAYTLRDMGRFDQAIDAYRQNLPLTTRVSGPHHGDTMLLRGALADALIDTGRSAEALPMLQQHYAELVQMFGRSHRVTLRTGASLAMAQRQEGQIDAAQALFADTLAGQERLLGTDHPDTDHSRAGLGYMIAAQNRHAEAIPMFQQVLDHDIARGSGTSDQALQMRHLIGVSLQALGRLQDAVAVHREALALELKALPQGHWLPAVTMSVLGNSLGKLGHYSEAEALFDQAISRLSASSVDSRFLLRTRELQAQTRAAHAAQVAASG